MESMFPSETLAGAHRTIQHSVQNIELFGLLKTWEFLPFLLTWRIRFSGLFPFRNDCDAINIIASRQDSLGGGSAWRKAATYTGRHKHKKKTQTDIHVLNGIQTYDPSFWAHKNISCLRLSGRYDWRKLNCRLFGIKLEVLSLYNQESGEIVLVRFSIKSNQLLRNRVPLEKPIIARSQEILLLLWKPKVHNRVNTNLSLFLVLTHIKPQHNIICCLPKVHFNIIFSSTPRFPKSYLLSRYRNK
jgi:hypothetical protein